MNLGKELRKIWNELDGRALITRAYESDPVRTAMELHYLGAGDIAGDLKLSAERAAKAEAGEKDRQVA